MWGVQSQRLELASLTITTINWQKHKSNYENLPRYLSTHVAAEFVLHFQVKKVSTF
jgi:hypothetical protein